MFDLAVAMGGTKGAAAANGAGMLVNGHSNGHSNGRNAAAATTTPAAAAGAAATAMAQTLTAAAAAAAGEELASLVDPLGQGRMENNITPYPVRVSLACVPCPLARLPTRPLDCLPPCRPHSPAPC